MRRGNENKKIFGMTLKVYRKGTGITQEDLSEAVLSSRAWISKIERGIASPNCIDTLLIIRALGFTTDGFDEFLSCIVDLSECSGNPKVEARRKSLLSQQREK